MAFYAIRLRHILDICHGKRKENLKNSEICEFLFLFLQGYGII